MLACLLEVNINVTSLDISLLVTLLKWSPFFILILYIMTAPRGERTVFLVNLSFPSVEHSAWYPIDVPYKFVELAK